MHRIQRSLPRLLGGAFLVLLAATIVHAQAGSTAQISGIVKDTSGGVLPGADVMATQTDTGVKRSAVTDSAGADNAPNLPIGPDHPEGSLSGVESYLRPGILLQGKAHPTVDA